MDITRTRTWFRRLSGPRLLGSALAIGAAVALVGAAMAARDVAPAAPDPGAVHQESAADRAPVGGPAGSGDTASDGQVVDRADPDYWTDERMRDAVPEPMPRE